VNEKQDGAQNMMDGIVLEDIERIKGDMRKELFDRKHVLISGGAGFIGAWLCDALTSCGAKVDCLDNLSTGKIENIDHLLGKPNFRFIHEDVCEFRANTEYDYILHLASRPLPEDYRRYPIETLRADSIGSFNMLELARKHDSSILLASTSHVYGDASVSPTPESYEGNVNHIVPLSCYPEGKRFAEALFMAYNRQYALNVRIARIFNSYGPRFGKEGAYDKVISQFIAQALANEPLIVYGDGTQMRSFCYISDTCTGLLLLLVNDRARAAFINIGNPEEVVILELARKIKQLTKSFSPIAFCQFPKDEPRRRCPEIERAKRLLAWEPEIGLEQGLARTINWFRGKTV
jgi:UDP-glucuronate decarboxylase